MKTYEFIKEFRIGENFPQQLKFFSKGILSKSTQMTLIKKDNDCYWYFNTSDHIVIPPFFETIVKQVKDMPSSKNKYYLYNDNLNKKSIVLNSLSDFQLETLFYLEESFTLSFELKEKTICQVGTQGEMFFISSDNEKTLMIINNWLGNEGLVLKQKGSKKGITISINRNSIPFILRPPISSPNYNAYELISKTYHYPNTFEKLFENVDIFTRHSLICGSSGSGKTHTTKKILDNVVLDDNINFLLFDIKGDYKDWALKNKMEYLNIGDNPSELQKLNLNPFLPSKHLRLTTQIELLSLIFSISQFGGASTLLPSYFNMIIKYFYSDLFFGILKKEKMIEIEKNKNNYNSNDEKDAYKRLKELEKQFTHLLNTKGNSKVFKQQHLQEAFQKFIDFWDRNSARDILLRKIFGTQFSRNRIETESIIFARINNLRHGIFNFFDYSKKAAPIENLLNRKLIISLQGCPKSESDLIVSLILLYTLSSLLAKENTQNGKLNNLIIIEEAHNIAKKEKESSDFNSVSNQLSSLIERGLAELRSKGVGLIIIEQQPSLLTEGTLANTAIKISHNLVGKDKESVSMSMNLPKDFDLTTLRTGECYLKFGSSHPIKLKVPN